MMVLVDTSVWIELFAGRPIPQVKILETLVTEKADIYVCGIILTEVLQGIRREKEYKKTKGLFESLIFLPMTHATFVRSAEIYRYLRRHGITIRNPVDCLIASVAIEHDIPLLHNDRDFDRIEEHFGLSPIHKIGSRTKPRRRRVKARLFSDLLAFKPEMIATTPEALALADAYQQHGILTPKFGCKEWDQ